MTNEELLLAYQSGDEAAFTALVENCLPFAYRYAQRELSDHQQAEEENPKAVFSHGCTVFPGKLAIGQ